MCSVRKSRTCIDPVALLDTRISSRYGTAQDSRKWKYAGGTRELAKSNVNARMHDDDDNTELATMLDTYVYYVPIRSSVEAPMIDPLASCLIMVHS